jgi:hypothetical protein
MIFFGVNKLIHDGGCKSIGTISLGSALCTIVNLYFTLYHGPKSIGNFVRIRASRLIINTLLITISMPLDFLYVVLFFNRNIFVNSCSDSGSQNGSFRGKL